MFLGPRGVRNICPISEFGVFSLYNNLFVLEITLKVLRKLWARCGYLARCGYNLKFPCRKSLCHLFEGTKDKGSQRKIWQQKQMFSSKIL